ncbi:MAG: lytic murein transglycosylase, partial [Beijerinckiaceae bacterium]
LTFDPGPGRASGGQGEFQRPFWDYVNGAVSPARISAGKAAAGRAEGALTWVRSNLGVDRGVVMGIWGMESNFGAGMGSSDVLRSTASLAFQGTRGDFYRQQFVAALKILEGGHVTRQGLVGSWAGAMGQPQFIPTSFLKYAIDADGDGRKDIWRSTADALASAANHLKLDGWTSGLPSAFEVALPERFDWAYGDRTARHDFALLQRIGLRRPDGQPLPARGQGGVFLPTGVNGPAFVVTDNFEVIRQYNTSDSYALAVGHLGDRIFGGPSIRRAWPTGERQLSTSEITELQRILQARGHQVGRIDGRIGQGTRKLVQIEQKRLGMVPDGHPSPAVLARLRGG